MVTRQYQTSRLISDIRSDGLTNSVRQEECLSEQTKREKTQNEMTVTHSIYLYHNDIYQVCTI